MSTSALFTLHMNSKMQPTLMGGHNVLADFEVAAYVCFPQQQTASCSFTSLLKHKGVLRHAVQVEYIVLPVLFLLRYSLRSTQAAFWVQT